MKRRNFLKTAGAIPFISDVPVAHKSHFDKPNDVVVIGAGVFGVWTAFYLREMGANVTLVDAYGPGNSRSSSGGESRILRSDYGTRLYYSHLNIRAYQLWKKWQDQWNESFLFSTGRLILGLSDQFEEREADKTQLDKLGIESKFLNRDELQYRWPQINFDGIEKGWYFEGGAGGSAIMARRSVQVVAQKFVELGGKFITDRIRPHFDQSGKLQGISGLKMKNVTADAYVFACGPWMPKLFPSIFEQKLNVFRRDVLFVGTKSGDDRFSHPKFPVWSFINPKDKRYYGMPDLEGRGLKVAPWPDYNSIDMDSDERMTHPIEIKRAHEFVSRRFPDLKGQPIVETRVCQLTFSEDDNFVIDHHPEMENLWMMCGGSGHGFKHGPALGEYMANRLLTGKKNTELDLAFAIDKN